MSCPPAPPHRKGQGHQSEQTGHGPSSHMPPLPPPKIYPAINVTREHLHQPQDGASRSVSFAPSVEHNAPHQHQDEVSVELEDLALGESASEHDNASSSMRSLISDAPSVEHFNISFEFRKTFREHSGARAKKCFHKVLKKVYENTLTWSYNVILFALGIVLAILWGLINAAISFLQTWGISPLMRASLVIVRGLLPIILEPLGLILKMCATSCGCGNGCMESLGGLQNHRFGLGGRFNV